MSDIVRQVSQLYFALRQSDIETDGFSDIIFALKLAKRISLGLSPNITAKQYNSPLANITEAHFLTECASSASGFKFKEISKRPVRS